MILRRPPTLAALAPLLLALGAVPAQADEGAAFVLAAADVSGVVVTAPRDDTYHAKRTSSATRTDTPLLDVPQAVSVITDELIRDQSMQGMADVVRYVPGVGMGQGEGHRDAPTLRGNASTADFFVDGVRDDLQYFRDLYNAERVEILKGPNAMIFGRGGGGGVINRVTKRAAWSADRSLGVELGSWDHRRITTDLAQPFSDALSGRLVGVYENSESFRDFVQVERWGVNPTLGWRNGAGLTLALGYEHFQDDRTVDRGIPSFNGRPAPAPISRFFGDPDLSQAATTVDVVSGTAEYVASADLVVRNRTVLGVYDKFYRNVFASGAAIADGTGAPALQPLQAYNTATERQNLFNQTDLVWTARTGGLEHTVLAGLELGRQETDNRRLTGFFNNTATTLTAGFGAPTLRGVPVTFRPNATDADNHVVATVAAVYLQDQLEISKHLQLIAGVRLDSFDLDFRDNRTGALFSRRDELVSPRLGLVLKPAEAVSFYASYSVSYLPSSGDQFGSLSATTQAFKPEEFTNHEVGAKWDLTPELALTVAAYRLDRDNTTAPDPARPGVIVLTGAQRSRGVEASISGKLTDAWEIMGGYAWQEAEITRRTAASGAFAGNRVALVPEHSFSLWNKYQVAPRLALGLGVVSRSKVFAAVDNTVTLPGFTRADAAVFLRLSDSLRAQVNVENLFDKRYFPTSHGNNNILPGAPRAVRVSLTGSF
ncbi:TonB-dependent receptor [Phenylobacterium sp.]|uniref:TonB-dependent receptor n=1 Tax=Phenylobacterium sp. TaxID=1871053 RepID=UPI0039839586